MRIASLIACGVALLASSIPSAGERVLHSFCSASPCSDGKNPQGQLIDVKGTLYGTTFLGGAVSCGGTGCGTVFSYDRRNRAESVVYSFGGYTCDTGCNAVGRLAEASGILYGMTQNGGGGGGVIFSVDPATGTEKVLHNFSGEKDGEAPAAGLLKVKGTLYGTTIVGGTYRCCGTVFSFDIATGKETVLHSFGNTGDGDGPAAELVDIRGKLYGTTSMGGAGSCYFGCGTVFSVDRATGEEKVLYSFGAFSYDGQGPYSSVIDVNGKLYGTTSAGGTYGFGTVFSFDLRKGTETILFNFGRVYQTGASPETGLVDVNGVLYGTTSGGGNYGGGTVYAIETTGGKETILHSFGNGVDGYEPLGGLLNVNGTFYGTTNIGGSSNDICEYDLSSCGTIFKLKP